MNDEMENDENGHLLFATSSTQKHNTIDERESMKVKLKKMHLNGS